LDEAGIEKLQQKIEKDLKEYYKNISLSGGLKSPMVPPVQ
jgi:hypothetical protein